MQYFDSAKCQPTSLQQEAHQPPFSKRLTNLPSARGRPTSLQLPLIDDMLEGALRWFFPPGLKSKPRPADGEIWSYINMADIEGKCLINTYMDKCSIASVANSEIMIIHKHDWTLRRSARWTHTWQVLYSLSSTWLTLSLLWERCGLAVDSVLQQGRI